MTDESPKRPKETGVTSNAELRALIDEWRDDAEQIEQATGVYPPALTECAADLEALIED